MALYPSQTRLVSYAGRQEQKYDNATLARKLKAKQDGWTAATTGLVGHESENWRITLLVAGKGAMAIG